MTVRNLGDWSPLGLLADPVEGADVDKMEMAQRTYKKIAVTVEDAINKLGKIVGHRGETLRGEYVEGLKGEAETLRNDLRKVQVRYDDVVAEITKYRPAVDTALDETKKALEQARDAEAARTKAEGMPSPQTGLLVPPSSEDTEKLQAKAKALEAADTDLSKAKGRLDRAMNDLNNAGKAFGDAVNCENYDDGLTSDTIGDRFLDFLEVFSKFLGGLGALLAIIAIFVPGVNLILAGLAVVSSLSFVVDIVLYESGRGSLLDVILSGVGLILLGGGALASLAGKDAAMVARYNAIQQRPPPQVGQLNLLEGGLYESVILEENAATQWKNLSDWFNNPFTNWLIEKIFGLRYVPDIGFTESMGHQWRAIKEMWRNVSKANYLSKVKELISIMGGLNGARDLARVQWVLKETTSVWWFVWGASNGIYNLFHGVVYTILRLTETFPAVNPDKS